MTLIKHVTLDPKTGAMRRGARARKQGNRLPCCELATGRTPQGDDLKLYEAYDTDADAADLSYCPDCGKVHAPLVWAYTRNDDDLLLQHFCELDLIFVGDEAPKDAATPVTTVTPDVVADPVPATDEATAIATAIGEILGKRGNGMTPEQVASIAADTAARVADEKIAAMPDRPERVVVVRDGERKVLPDDKLSHKLFGRMVELLSKSQRLMPLMYGPAGTGKTSAVEDAAELLGVEYGMIALSAATTKFDLLGGKLPNGEVVETPLARIFEHGGIFLFDEIDQATPNALKSVNALLANRFIELPGGRMVEKHNDARFIAASNSTTRGATRAHAGAQPMDKSTRSRFAYLYVDYDDKFERALCERTGASDSDVTRVIKFVHKVRANLAKHSIETEDAGMRSTLGMCEMLATETGSFDDGVACFVERGMPADLWSKVSDGYRIDSDFAHPANR